MHLNIYNVASHYIQKIGLPVLPGCRQQQRLAARRAPRHAMRGGRQPVGQIVA
jgi:hypothetical protein